MGRMKAFTDAELLACHCAQLSVVEAANYLAVSPAAVTKRAKALGLLFNNRQGQPARRITMAEVRCASCPMHKLCLLCHKLRADVVPCEKPLVINGVPECAQTNPEQWNMRLARLQPAQ